MAIEREELDPFEIKKDLNMSKSNDRSKEKENVIHSEKSKESDQDETLRETKKGSHVICFTCDEPRHIEDDCKGKSFKPISNFYCNNCHGYGHNVIDCKKPKFDNDNANSRMFRDTNLACSRRKRSHRNASRGRRNISIC